MNNTIFKIGDRVKAMVDNHMGEVKKGTILTVTYVADNFFAGDSKFGGLAMCDYCLVKDFKESPVQYIAIYDLVDRDPTKTFTSKKELNKWLKEAKNDKDVIFDSIKIFEVKKQYSVQTTFRLKLEKR